MSRRPTPLRLFDRHWSGWQREFRGGRLAPTGRIVHLLRVRSRRVLALLALLEDLVPFSGRTRKPVTRIIDATLHELSSLRDAHVQRKLVKRRAAATPALQGLLQYLMRREARHVRRARRSLGHLDLAHAQRGAAGLRAAIVAARIRAATPGLTAHVHAAADQAFADVLRRLSRLDADRPSTVHRLRVDLKQFRYTAEIAEDLTASVGAARMATIRALQNTMGELQDIELLVKRIDRFQRHHGAAQAVDDLRDALWRRRADLIADILADRAAVAGLWPPTRRGRSRPPAAPD